MCAINIVPQKSLKFYPISPQAPPLEREETSQSIDAILFETIDQLIDERPQQPIWTWMRDYIETKLSNFSTSPNTILRNGFYVKIFKTIYFLKNRTPNCNRTPRNYDWRLLDNLCKPINGQDTPKDYFITNIEIINQTNKITPPLTESQNTDHQMPTDRDLIRGTLTEILLLYAFKSHYPQNIEIADWYQDLCGIDALIKILEKPEPLFFTYIPIDIKCTNSDTPSTWIKRDGYNIPELNISSSRLLHPLILLALAESVDAQSWIFRNIGLMRSQTGIKTPLTQTSYLEQTRPDGVTLLPASQVLAGDLVGFVQHMLENRRPDIQLLHFQC